MKNKTLNLMAIFMFTVLSVFAQSKTADVFALDFNVLSANKEKLKNGDKNLQKPYNKLLHDADELVKNDKLFTVMEKKQNPPSGDMHDYMSLALYFWPDPEKPNGLPYIRKDGQINPEVESYKDKTNINKMIKTIEVTSLAYYFSEDQKYADKAIAQIRAWFLDPATKMNPNFNFAQAIKGKNDGRGIGIIECREFIKVIDGIGLIKSNPSWTKKDQKGMEKWFTEFLIWFTTSKNGIEEMNTKNNHGIWYDAQKLSYSLFTQNKEIALSTIKSIQSRLELQMDTTGFFPEEMARTISLHYEAFIIEPLFMIAHMSDGLGIDMWNYTTSTGKSIKKGFEVLMPYLAKEKEWTGQQIKPFEFVGNGIPLLAQGYYKYNCKNCREGIYRISEKAGEESLSHLTSLID